MQLETIRTIVFTILLGALPFLSLSMLLTHIYYSAKYDVKSEPLVIGFSFMLMLPALIILTSIASQIN